MRAWLVGTVVATVVAGALSPAMAGDDSLETKVQRLESLVEAQADRIRTLESTRSETWLNERRAEEVKTLVREVLADADSRAALMDSAITGGHDGETFFLMSGDNNFRMNLSGLIQARYVFNYVTNKDDDDSFENPESGFQNRRSRVRLDGHVVNPKIRYGLQFNFTFEENNNDGNINGPGTEDDTSGFGFLEEAWMAYDFDNGWSLQAGQFKGPFAREELVNADFQLAVERSFVTDYFTLDFVQGVMADWAGEINGKPVRFAAMIHDGSYSSAINFNQELVDFAIAARAETLLIGEDWRQARDFTTFSDQQEMLLVGVGVDWQLGNNGEGANEQDDSNHVKFTVDGSYENPEWQNFNAFAAYYGQYIYEAASSSTSLFPGAPMDDDYYQQAVVVQAGVHVIPDKLEIFGRYEYMDTDGVIYFQSPEDSADRSFFLLGADEQDEYNIITVGANYFIARHDAKLSLDFMYVIDDISSSATNTGAGIEGPSTTDDDAEQFVIRAQAQVRF